MEIPAIDQQTWEAARAHQAQLTKPTGALGRLEELACWFAARQGKAVPDLLRPAIVVFAADHGVAREGVSAYPREVTAQMVRNFAAGGAAINVLARRCDAKLSIVDVGVDADLSDVDMLEHAKVRAHGSGNIAREPAMNDAQYWEAVGIGEEMAARAIAAGANLLIAGDMGIGNTTPSAAVICALTGAAPEQVVGRGTGVDDATYGRKLAVVEQALARADGTLSRDVLRELGGLEIAAMAGFYRAAARHGVPVLLDGFISAAAALAALAWDVRVSGWMLASHVSAEAGHRLALRELGLAPLLDFGMRLGEGTGAALAVPLLNAALALHREMATFASAGVSDRA
ncbi:MAG: nicotinate-nucleotide--dimethylbenzimidazole phosphoribosyltransferase [Zetaproteobacteria bacterium]|nr:MAG: nicotinate-nucleotide--dimethylbenzimidazole phosphoribosyltransferase [Zetaproteobacteria bacterium]